VEFPGGNCKQRPGICFHGRVISESQSENFTKPGIIVLIGHIKMLHLILTDDFDHPSQSFDTNNISLNQIKIKMYKLQMSPFFNHSQHNLTKNYIGACVNQRIIIARFPGTVVVVIV
jgi:hypothetical protein